MVFQFFISHSTKYRTSTINNLSLGPHVHRFALFSYQIGLSLFTRPQKRNICRSENGIGFHIYRTCKQYHRVIISIFYSYVFNGARRRLIDWNMFLYSPHLIFPTVMFLSTLTQITVTQGLGSAHSRCSKHHVASCWFSMWLCFFIFLAASVKSPNRGRNRWKKAEMSVTALQCQQLLWRERAGESLCQHAGQATRGGGDSHCPGGLVRWWSKD